MARRAIRGNTLYRILFAGIILTILGVGILSVWGVREVRRDAARVAVESSAKGLSGAVSVLVGAMATEGDGVNTSLYADLRHRALRKTLPVLFEKHQGLAAVLVSDANGMHYALTRTGDGLVEVVPDDASAIGVQWARITAKGTVEPIAPVHRLDWRDVNTMIVKEFETLVPGQVNWQATNALDNAGKPWVTASTVIRSNDTKIMISYVFPVEVLVRHLANAEKGSAEKIFLYWKNGEILPVGGVEPDAARNPATVIGYATRMLSEGKAATGVPFFFRLETVGWWTYVLPLSVFGDTIAIGVAVPQAAVIQALVSDTFIEVFGGLLGLLAVVALIVLHRNRTRIEAMGLRQKAAVSDTDILTLVAEGEGASLEFKQTLRFNLKAGKNGKEIEHASLKSVAGFLNSEGGTLLVGVADNGVVTGFAEDRFENGDKALLHFNNLVNEHIGTEFSRYLDSRLIVVQGRIVLRVYCMPAPVPAILRTQKGEEFYVRSGPASRQLTLSQFYEWLQRH